MSPFWACAGITALSAYVSLGFALVPLRPGSATANRGDRYALVRSLALATVATIVLFTRTESWLEAIALAMILVQAGDAVVGWVLRDPMKTIGPAALSVINLAAVLWLIR